MAKAEADKSAEPKRRILKKVETVREKADKEANKPEKKQGVIGLALHYIAVPFKKVGRPLVKYGAKIGHLKPFRILGLILFPTYFRNSWKELKQVTWPSRKQSWQLTLAVIVFATIFGVLIAIVDFGLDRLFKQVLLK